MTQDNDNISNQINPNHKIITTNDYKIIEEQILASNQDTLVIFDVDEVLLQPKDQLLKIYNVDNMANLFKEIKDRLSTKQAWELESIILLQAEYESVNKDILNLINETQNAGIKVLALTQLMTGEFGKIKSLADWRIEVLHRLGYDLNKSWLDIAAKNFSELPSIRYPDCAPIFKDGVVFACDHPKDKVLKLFLNYASFSPKNIIIIDDMQTHIDNMVAFASNNNINLVGIVYNAAYDSLHIEPFNEKRALMQLKTLEKEHKWLSDRNADNQIIK